MRDFSWAGSLPDFHEARSTEYPRTLQGIVVGGQDNLDDHEELPDEIRDLMDEFVADSGKGAQLLEERLSSWFGNHFASFDARLHGKLGPH